MDPTTQLRRYQRTHRIERIVRNGQVLCAIDEIPVSPQTHRWIHDLDTIKSLRAAGVLDRYPVKP